MSAAALFAACLISFPGAARAESTPRAESVPNPVPARVMLYQILEYVSEKIASSIEGSTLTMAGVPAAEAAEDKTELVFPLASVVGVNGDGLGLGTITATVSQKDQESFEFSIGLPKYMNITDTDGNREGRISWSDSAISGTWRADLETATVIHAALNDVNVTAQVQGESQSMAKIGSLRLDQEFVKTGNGWWSGPYSYDVVELELTPPSEENHISMEKLSLSGKLQGFNLAAWQALSEWGSEMSIELDDADPVPFENGIEAARIFEAMNLGAGNMYLSISGLRHGPPGLNQSKLDGFSLRMSYDNGARPGAYSLALAWQGLEEAVKILPPAFVTHTGSLKLHFEQLPLRQIATTSLRQAAATDSFGKNVYAVEFDKTILPLLNANQTALRLEELVLRSSAAALFASGKLSAQAGSALGVVGTARVEIAGLDKLIAAAARWAVSGGDAQNLLALLTIAKGLGRPEIGAEGEIVYVFDIAVPPDGTVTINEIPLDLLQDSGRTALPKPPARSATASAQ